MAVDRLKDVADYYDVVVIGSGLAGLTSANYLAKNGHSVLLLEHHYQLGGLATWFRRKGGHIFDISLHGFPIGMVKSCRKYWTQDIAKSIVQLKGVRFINPQFSIDTTFDRKDFTDKLITVFKIPESQVHAFFDHLRKMNFYDDDHRTIRDLLNEFFPGRSDVHRLLMEPIAYANGSSLDDPAITYGIVFSNFMSEGVYTFQGGTDTLIKTMAEEMQQNGVTLKKLVLVEKILTEQGEDGKHRVCGIQANGKRIRTKAVISNSNIKNTVQQLLEPGSIPEDFQRQTQAVRVNSSSCQVYMGIKEGEHLPHIGDLIFVSKSPSFSSKELLDLHTKSRTFSMYYPETRPHLKEKRYAVVASLNARWEDWANLSDEEYAFHKNRIEQESIDSLAEFIPDIRDKIDWIEAATPRTINHYTRHFQGTSFGTKFEGLKVSMDLPEVVPGLYHAGSVGIIMSGWLGSINYGVITANKCDKFLYSQKNKAETEQLATQSL